MSDDTVEDLSQSNSALDNVKKLKQLSKELPTVAQIHTRMLVEQSAQQAVTIEEEIEEEEEEKGEEEHVPETAKPAEKDAKAEKAAASDEGEEEELLLIEDLIEEAIEEEKESSKEDEDEEEEDKKKEEDDMMMMGFVEEEKPKEISYVKSEVIEEVEEEDILDPSPIINSIIDFAVKSVELIDRVTFLRKTLNRNKIIKHLIAEYNGIIIAQKRQFLLNRKVVDFFRKKKGGRALSDDNPNIISKIIKKYRMNLKRLDDVRTRLKHLNEELVEKIEIATNTEAELNEKCQKDTKKLEDTLRTDGAICFSKISGNFLSERVIENIIKKIGKLRIEMSKLRLEVIETQHNLASLQYKVEKIDDLGNGLRMMEFEQLDTEVKNIGEKIEERLTDLFKYRRVYFALIHIISHFMEKKEHLLNQLKRTEIDYTEVRKQYRKQRNLVHDLKLERDRARKVYEDLSFSCGLLDKPKLLYDYDLTYEKVVSIERELNPIRAENKQIMEQLKVLQEQIKRHNF